MFEKGRKFTEWILSKFKKEEKENRFEKQLNRKISRKLEIWVKKEKFTEHEATQSSVAEELGVTPEEFAYYFKSRLGTNFGAWRKSLRIEHAKILLINYPDLSISEIGRMCGILDRSDFRRQFLEMTGKYPLDWQKEHLMSQSL